MEKDESKGILKNTGFVLKKADQAKLTKMLINLGFRAGLCGFHYFKTGVELVVEDRTYMGSLTKKLYPTIAERFGSTSSKVERGIRHSIKTAWERHESEQKFNSVLGFKAFSRHEKPTNGEFIALVAEKIIMDSAEF